MPISDLHYLIQPILEVATASLLIVEVKTRLWF
jgi:hypothetical protein